MRRIVLGCDLADATHPAVGCALHLSAAFGAELHLLHAIEAPFEREPAESIDAPYEKRQEMLVARRLEALNELVCAAIGDGKTPPAGVQGVRSLLQTGRLTADRVKPVVLQGNPGEELAAYTQQVAADLVVLGIRRHGLLGKLMGVSTTEALLRHGPCPVLVVPSPAAAGESAPLQHRTKP